MANITTIANPLGGADQVSLMHLLAGEQRELSGKFTDNDAPVDITNFAITAQAEHYMADVNGDNISNMVLVDALPTFTLPVTVVNAAQGSFSVTIDKDIISDMRNPEANATRIPVVAVYFSYADHAASPNFVFKHRMLLTFRRGHT